MRTLASLVVPVQPGEYLTPEFAQTQGQQENGLEGKMLQGNLPEGFKRRFNELVKHYGQVSGGNA